MIKAVTRNELDLTTNAPMWIIHAGTYQCVGVARWTSFNYALGMIMVCVSGYDKG